MRFICLILTWKFLQHIPHFVAPKLQAELIYSPKLQNHVIQRTSASLNKIDYVFYIGD